MKHLLTSCLLLLSSFTMANECMKLNVVVMNDLSGSVDDNVLLEKSLDFNKQIIELLATNKHLQLANIFFSDRVSYVENFSNNYAKHLKALERFLLPSHSSNTYIHTAFDATLDIWEKFAHKNPTLAQRQTVFVLISDGDPDLLRRQDSAKDLYEFLYFDEHDYQGSIAPHVYFKRQTKNSSSIDRKWRKQYALQKAIKIQQLKSSGFPNTKLLSISPYSSNLTDESFLKTIVDHAQYYYFQNDFERLLNFIESYSDCL